MPMYKSLLIVVAALILSACVKQPSSADLSQAMQVSIDQVNQILSSNQNEPLGLIVLHSLKKINCSRIGNSPKFSCLVEADETLPSQGRSTSRIPIVVVKTENGWRIPMPE